MLHQVLAACGIALWEAWDRPLELIDFTAGREDTWRLSPAQTAKGTLWDDNIYPADREKLHAYLRNSALAHAQCPIDYRLIVGDGELLWVRHWTLSRNIAPDQRLRLRNAIMPIPEQKHLEWECLRVSERECNRIGQELHDDLCQVLAGIGFMMRLLEQRARKVDSALATEIDELNSHLFSATDRVRSMAHGLFPAQLHFASLRDALNGFAAEARTLFRIDVAAEIPKTLPRQRPEQIIQVYRIVQEAVSNAVRHGHADSVSIEVTTSDSMIRVRVTDNGSGFAAAQTRPEGIGMHVMQYRANALSGSLTISPLEARGVAIHLEYPVCPPTPATPLETNPHV